MASFHNLLSKCDQALVAYLIANNAGTAADVLPSKKSTEKTLPVTICRAMTARPEASPYSGSYLAEVMVYIRSLGVAEEDSENSADVPRINSDQRVAATFDLFQTDPNSGNQLGIDITNAAQAAGVLDFTAINVEVKEIEAGFEAKGDAWMDAIHLEILCCPVFIPET